MPTQHLGGLFWCLPSTSKTQLKNLLTLSTTFLCSMTVVLISLLLSLLKVLPARTVPVVTTVPSGGLTVATVSRVSVTATQMCVTEKLAGAW